MERVQVLKGIKGQVFSKVLAVCLCLFLFSSCASNKFVEVNEEFQKEEEYDAILAVKSSDPVEKGESPFQEELTPSPVAKETSGYILHPEASPMDANKSKTQKKTLEKKDKLIKKTKEFKRKPILIPQKTEKKGARLPEMEDEEGFEGRRPKVDPFRVGEEVELDVSYLGVVAGTLSLKVMPFVEVNGRKAYHFRVAVKSNSSFSFFFKVDDWSDTYVDYETLLPFNYTTHVDHSNEKKEIRVLFDHTKKQVKIWEKKIDKSGVMKKKTHEWEMQDFSQNVISIFFYIRNFQLSPGKVLKIPMTDEDNNMILEAKVLKREEIEGPEGKIKTVVIEPKASVKGKFKQSGEVKLWLTDDDRKMIVKVVAEIQIGNLRFKLNKYKPN